MKIEKYSSDEICNIDPDVFIKGIIEICKNRKIVMSNDDKISNEINELKIKNMKYNNLIEQSHNIKKEMISKYEKISQQVENLKSKLLNELKIES